MTKNTTLPNYQAIMKDALIQLKTIRIELDTLKKAQTEPIAIVGASCRLPGNINTPEAFWHLLCQGINTAQIIPLNRWDVEKYYDPEKGKSGKLYTKKASFVSEVDRFDPQFFNISPREAVTMDPQQRLLLEVTWESLERAGIVPQILQGSQTGVFLGIMNQDYRNLAIGPSLNNHDIHTGTGNAISATAGRIAYILGLQGPTISIDTACSSSLVAIHLACQSLRLKECNLALACGVNLILTPDVTVAECQAHMLAPDGLCKTFDAKADGFARGEGCITIVLKRLSDAVANNDNIIALIRGSAVNQDGKSGGLTVPNGLAQQTLIKQALNNGQINPAEISYIEAHGTGTSLGDPIEIEALDKVFGNGRSTENALLVGSVKTNFGHLEGAAGVVGVLKAALAIQHGQIPPHLNFEQPNPYIPWDKLPIKIPTKLISWPNDITNRLAGVSSFGFSGTNAHVILQQYNRRPPTADHRWERPLHLLTLSAKTEKALAELLARYENYLSDNEDLTLQDVCYTANTGRSHFKHRLGLIANSSTDLLEKVRVAQTNQDISGVISGKIEGTPSSKIAFLFTGQGAQYVNMGQTLYKTQPTFRQAIDKCADILDAYLDVSLLEVLYPELQGCKDAELIDMTAYTQPALFALEYALAQLWMSWGIIPDILIGHSVGEYVAACIAGVFSLEDGLKLIAHRGRLMGELPQSGQMVAIECANKRMGEWANNVSVAAVNGPRNTVISGAVEAVQTVVDKFEKEGIKCTKLQTSHAFHSALMEPMMIEFEVIAQQISYHPPQINLISNLSGQLIANEVTQAAYWVNHIRQPVLFAQGINTLQKENATTLIEIGPKPTLLGMARQCAEHLSLEEADHAPRITYLTSLRPKRSDWQQVLESLTHLYTQGVKINWLGFDKDYKRYKVVLPTYPFQRQRYWVENKTEQNRFYSTFSNQPPIHPLVQYKLPLAGKQVGYQSQLSATNPPFLTDHQVFDKVLLPATAYLEMALVVGKQIFNIQQPSLQNISIQEGLILNEDTLQTIQIIVQPQHTQAIFEIYSLNNNESSNEQNWHLHSSGLIINPEDKPALPALQLADLQQLCFEKIEIKAYYEQIQEQGISYGPAFQAITDLRQGPTQALAHIQLPEALLPKASEYHLHPIVLDACLQILGAALPQQSQASTYLPIGFDNLQIYQPIGTDVWSYAQIEPQNGTSEQTIKANITLLNKQDEVLGTIMGITLKQANFEALLKTQQNKWQDWLYKIAWQPQALSHLLNTNKLKDTTWLILADSQGFGEQLATALLAREATPILIFAKSPETPNLIVDMPLHHQFTINPANLIEFEETLQIVTENAPLTGIIYLWGLTEFEIASFTETELKQQSIYNCGSLLHLVQTLSKNTLSHVSSLWIVTQGAVVVGETTLTEMQPTLSGLVQSPLWGLSKTITLEYPNLQCIKLDLDPAPKNQNLEMLLAELENEDDNKEDQLAFRNHLRYVARLTHSNLNNSTTLNLTQPFQLTISQRGSLDNLSLTPSIRYSPAEDEVEIEVQATGLNFRDVLNVLGMYPGDPGQPGVECAGQIVAVGSNVTHLTIGQAVVAIVNGAFNRYVTVSTHSVISKPDFLTYQEAATIPATFLTVYFTLMHQTRLQSGQRILIHAAAGGIGQTAIQVAHHLGAEVYATASPSKWDFLRKQGVKHIFNSRTLDFAEQILDLTNGEGVDVVLNSLSDEFIPKSLSVLRLGGHFAEIGKRGIWSQKDIDNLNKNISYHVFDLAEQLARFPHLIQTALKEVMAHFKAEHFKPLPFKSFPIQNITDAFRYMQQAKHIGKIIVTQPKTLSGHGTYLITGGLGGLGLVVAKWLVEEKGIKHLALIGRSAKQNAQEQLKALIDLGAEIEVLQADISIRQDVERVLTHIKHTMPPLQGIIHAAGVLDDGVIQQQTWSRFEKVFAPKIQGAWHLHHLTQNKPLDCFILFSSVASLLGSLGQANYAAANAFMDALAHYRQSLGLTTLSINWGGWAEIGMFARQHLDKQASKKGIGVISPQAGISVLNYLFWQTTAQVGVLPINWSQFLQQYPPQNQPALLTQIVATIGQTTTSSILQQQTLQKQLLTASAAQKEALLATYLHQTISKIMGFNNQQLDQTRPLIELGLDSLLAVELKHHLDWLVDGGIPLGKLLSDLSLFDLQTLLTKALTETSTQKLTDSFDDDLQEITL